MSDKGQIGQKMSGALAKFESPINSNSNDYNTSHKSNKSTKSGLKSTKDGLISIEEQPSEKPNIKIANLGDVTPEVRKAKDSSKVKQVSQFADKSQTSEILSEKQKKKVAEIVEEEAEHEGLEDVEVKKEKIDGGVDGQDAAMLKLQSQGKSDDTKVDDVSQIVHILVVFGFKQPFCNIQYSAVIEIRNEQCKGLGKES